MPKSMARRIELLEAETARSKSDQWDTERLLVELERWARAPAEDQPAVFREAWAQYVTVRDTLDTQPSEPPSYYRRELPAARRRRLWLVWDRPELRDATDVLLRATIAALRPVVDAGPPGHGFRTGGPTRLG
jgi:hypothetical protein